jgi:hypothetical protein
VEHGYTDVISCVLYSGQFAGVVGGCREAVERSVGERDAGLPHGLELPDSRLEFGSDRFHFRPLIPCQNNPGDPVTNLPFGSGYRSAHGFDLGKREIPGTLVTIFWMLA